MASTLIVYGSTTGNTEFLAEKLEEVLQQKGHSVKKIDARSAEPKNLCQNYQAIFFGCSTWGFDDIELQDDFADLFEHFDDIKAQGKQVAVFGSGDTGYPHFCGAVDAIEQKLQELGADIIVESLKIDGSPQDEIEHIEKWANDIAQKI